MKKTKKNIFYWVTWLALVILWNFGWPEAKPLYDVLVAILLSFLFVILRKYEK